MKPWFGYHIPWFTFPDVAVHVDARSHPEAHLIPLRVSTRPLAQDAKGGFSIPGSRTQNRFRYLFSDDDNAPLILAPTDTPLWCPASKSSTKSPLAENYCTISIVAWFPP